MGLFEKGNFLVMICLLAFCFSASAQKVENHRKDLDFFLEKAEQSSPLIKDFSNQLLMNRIDSLIIRAGYQPHITASSTGLYAPRINGYGFDEVMTNGQSLDALLNVNYALTGSGLKANRTRGLQLQRDSLNYAIRISRLDLKKAITEQYIQAYASQQQVAFNLDINELLKDEEALLKELTRANVYRQTDYLSFLVTFKQQQLQSRQAELQLSSDLAMLNYLAGINDSSTTILSQPVFGLDTLNTLGQSFFTTRFEIDSLKAVNELKAIDFSYRPKVNLYVNGGYNSSLVLQPYKNFGASAGFTLSVPIYDGHQKVMQQDKINLQSNTSTLYKGFFVRQHAQQIQMLKQQIVATERLTQQIVEQIKLSRGLVDVDIKLLHTGDVKVADFVLAINNYMSAQNELRQSNINRLKLISQLNYWSR